MQRYDRASRLTKTDSTPQGGISAPAYLTRTGVLTYTYADGRKVRELRHPDDVFHADSMATLRGATLTVGHPGMVTPDNYQTLNVGHVGDDVRRDGGYVAATVRVQDAAAVAGVAKGDLIELSCGYTADVYPERGTHDGQEYDARQRNIRYNHVGLGAPNWGRAGSSVALRLDGDAAMSDTGCAYTRGTMTLEEQLAAVKAERDALKAKLDGQSTAELETLRGANKALTVQVAEIAAKLDAAEKTAQAATKRADGLELADAVTKAAKLAPKYDATDAKTRLDVARGALAVSHPTLKLDGDALIGAFEALASTVATPTAGNVGALNGTNAPTVRADAARADGAAVDPVLAAQSRMHSRTTPAKA